MTEFGSLLTDRLQGILTPTEKQLERMEAHFRLLLRWNEKLNLTRITDLPEAVTRHYAESAFLAANLPDESGLRIADIGSGGGFPGVPLAILRPDARVDLVESRTRKAAFLREAAADLRNCHVLAHRAEDLAGPYDWLVSRAVTPQEVLALRISPWVALLVGPEAAESPTERRIQLPWPGSGYLAISSHVPRET